MMNLTRAALFLLLSFTLRAAFASPDDGYDLWLRYHPLAPAAQAALAKNVSAISAPGLDDPRARAAIAELERGIKGMLGRAPARSATLKAGALVLATPRSLPAIAALGLPLSTLGAEGYLLRHVRLQGMPVTLIAAQSEIGLLYGSFAWLRAIGGGARPDTLAQSSSPALQLRVLDHWDNPDRSVERGYAGQSIWNWQALPRIEDSRYTDYARANASIGINGSVLNNVNARAEMLSAPWIAKTAAVAGALRPYGIKVYLSIRFSTPLELGETATADPLAAPVRAWWKAKADEIYRAIPDFGGFLVKANSEGQPGPQDYHRSHADGANMLAEALAPHGGVVMWRAFVYADDVPADRARQAYDQFKPLDGQFAANVLVQVKNGPIDFQPREPIHPLFGAMPRTPLMMEFQITKEYLGFSTHLAYLGSLFEEVLRTDTRVRPQGALVADVIDGSLQGTRPTGMAGVANIGDERTWSGSHFDQANWYAFGRMAWDPRASAGAIAREWITQTWTTEPRAVDTIAAMMMGSREAVVDYMTPLGLHHLMGTDHHYGPAPWVADLKRSEWNPVYYHRADAKGIGFDRTAAGSDAVGQYAPALAAQYENVKTTPPELLLWFHHLPWDYAMPSGRNLWTELIAHYDHGVATVAAMQKRWASLAGVIDPRRHADVAALLVKQHQEALWWRDASIAYFQSVSKLPLPPGVAPPAHSLDYYKSLHFPASQGRK
ncbi:MAG: alpha-glucuronidase family glycosyl hydrolase [Massilia sp.]